MARIIISGGKKLSGIWHLSGNKNEALPLIAASLLFGGGLKLKDLPDISDVGTMFEIVKALEKGGELPPDLCSKVRGSLLFLGPLLAIRGKTKIPRTGGDKIGLRKIDAHLEVFKAFNCKINNNEVALDRNYYNNPRPITIWLSEPSVTATENALLLTALREGTTIIKNAASEPHVANLGKALIGGGVKIDGLDTNLLTIRGAKRLRPITHTIGEDFMELGSVLVLSAIFSGKIKIKSNSIDDYPKVFEIFEKFGKRIVYENGYLRTLNVKASKRPIIHEISNGPWPGFPSDLISPMVILATQSKGQFLFHEKMFESRLYFTDQLKNLGAQLVLCDPHRVLVTGPTKLHGAHLVSPDIRAGIALVIAALAAKGKSIIDNAEQLDRGYEKLVEKLKSVGADIKEG